MSSVGSDSQSSRSSASHSSFSEGASVVSDNSDAAALTNLSDRDRDASVQDLLEQKGLWDAAFSCMLLLTESRSITSYRMLAFRVVFEFFQIFRLVFNTRFLWVINRDLWIWKTFYWVLFRFLIWEKGYSVYVQGLYVICSMVLVLAAATIGLMMILRKDSTRNIWLQRLIWLVQNVVLLMFSICWIPCLDYMAFMFTCSWGKGNAHLHWTDQVCTQMPHLGNMLFAGICAIIFIVAVVCLAMAECSGDHLTSNLTASPVAATALKVTALKIIMIVVSTCLDDFRKPQAVMMFICPVLTAWFQIRSSPYLRPWLNHIWSGLWFGLVYTTALLLTLNYHEVPAEHSYAFRKSMTWGVLYGIFPAVLLGMAVSHYAYKWACKPLKQYEQARQAAARGELQVESAAVMKRIYRLSCPEQVEFLARCVRRFDPTTDEPLPEAVALSGFIIQAGVAKFPGSPTVLVLYANYIIHVKKEPKSAQTQLQLASKNEPGFIDRYNIFCAMDVLKTSRSDSEGGLDLMAYVECQRNFRACVKAHKTALLAQRAFWRSLMRDDLQLSQLLATMKAMQQAEQTAIWVYQRVLERYPNNGRILRAWGKFQEWVLHNPAKAARAYNEAVKQGMGDNLLNLTSANDQSELAESGATISDQKVDDKTDGVIIIDATGSMLLINKAAYRMFGYAKGELEGKNVSMMMPQPFSSRHNAYMNNYLVTGAPKILNTHRHVVALRKDHSMFPVTLFVRRLSGTGQESVFMGVLKQVQESDPNLVRVWCTPGGTILCSDDKFGDWFGVNAEDLVGKSFSNLSRHPETLEKFLRDSSAATKEEAAEGELRMITPMLHKYLPAINVDITVYFGGSDTEQILMLYMQCLTEAQKMMVVDERGKVVYATSTLAAMLGTKVATLTKMTLPQLIPAPAAQLHAAWMKDQERRPWPGSCRGGDVVQMQNLVGVKIPVRINISTVEDDTGEKIATRYVVKVNKVSNEEHMDDRRVSVTVDQKGTVIAVEGSPPVTLFGFEAQTDLLGRSLASFINLFKDFRDALHERNSKGVDLEPASPKGQRDLDMLTSNNPQHSSSGLSGSSASDDALLLTILAQAAQAGTGLSYRVGVRAMPLDEEGLTNSVRVGEFSAAGGRDGTISGGSAVAGDFAALLSALGGQTAKKLVPAIMTVDVIEQDLSADGGDAVGLSAISAGLHFTVQLWPADRLTGTMEIDQQMKVVKADAGIGQMLGMEAAHLQRQSLGSVLKLPENIQAPGDLMTVVQGKKASALKSSKKHKDGQIGGVIAAEGRHAGGIESKLEIQAVAKEGQANRLILRVKLAAPVSRGTLQALLHQAGASGTSRALLGTAAIGNKSLRSQSFRNLGGAGSKSRNDMAAAAGSKSVKSLAAVAQGNKSGKVPVDRGPRNDADLYRGGSVGSMQSEDQQDLREQQERREQHVRREQKQQDKHHQRERTAAVEYNSMAASSRHGYQEVLHNARHDSASEDMEQPEYRAPKKQGRGDRSVNAASNDWPRIAEGRSGSDHDEEREYFNAKGSRFRQQQQRDDATNTRSSYEQPQQQQWKAKAPASATAGYDEDEQQGYADEYPEQGPGQGAYRGSYTGSVDRQFGGGGYRGSATGSVDMEGQPPGWRERHASATGSEGSSEDEASKLDAASLRGEEGEDITCDWRRAKRLRKIMRQLDSPVARSALWRFWRGSWLSIVLLLVTHITCYSVLVNRVAARQKDVFGVQQMTYAVDKSQMLLLRANYLSKCGFTSFQPLAVCAPAQRAVYIKKHYANIANLDYYHHGLFLGFDATKVTSMGDPQLLDWWLLPKHTEVDFMDMTPPSTPTDGQLSTQNTSLWELGNRYLYAARELGYAWQTLKQDAQVLEATRNWKFIYTNGMTSVFHGYAVSLDMYVRYCWTLLGDLRRAITVLLVLELIIIALSVMGWQMDLIRRAAGQRMTCFSVFLAVPSAMLRSMATAPCMVDDDDVDNEEDQDETELQELVQGVPSDQQPGLGSTGDAAARPGKTVRMSVTGADEIEDGIAQSKDVRSSLTGKKRAQGFKIEHHKSWMYRKFIKARHFSKGIMNRTLKVNGKKLRPARGAFARFMVPLFIWWVLALAIYGASFTSLGQLQAPLTSLQAAAHVQYALARTRVLANIIGFLPYNTDSPERSQLKASMRQELSNLEDQYFTMLYGGHFASQVSGDPDVQAGAAVFSDSALSDIYFRTKRCLRLDQTGCYHESSEWYSITHSGLDAMMQAFISNMEEFLSLPAALQNANASSYEYTWRVAANDLYDGLGTAGDLFVDTTLKALGHLKQLHTILLLCTLAIMGVLVLLLLIPFKRQLLEESVRLAGLLSLLPQEADIEGQVKSLVLDVAAHKKPSGDGANKGWTMARGITAAMGAARAAATRAAGAMGEMRSNRVGAMEQGLPAVAGGWQQQMQDDDDSSAPDWE